MKYLILESEDILNEMVDYLIKEIGLPSIHKRLNIYSGDDSVQIEVLDNRVFFKGSAQSKQVVIKNKNLKHFFEHIQSQNSKGYIINDIVLLKFPYINLLFNTFHGNILSVDNDNLLEQIKQKFNLKVYDNINDHTTVCTIKTEPLFDEIGNLNSKIKKYSVKTGLDIRSSSSSIRLRLSNLSNDYSHIEPYYKLISKNDLLSFKSTLTYTNKFESISIIIPAFNQNSIPTLLSIQGQSLSKEDKSKIQVVVVDDGSNRNVLEDINSIRNKLEYEINVISFDKNMGISNARNAGLSIAKHSLLLFMDSDIILSKNYIYDIDMRLQIVPNAIFVAMRKNIDTNSELTIEANLLKGIEGCLNFDDSRVITKSKEYHIGWDKAFKDEKISVLDDTDYFKELSFGSKIGIYDLSTVVTGHNMAINRELITKYPLFSTRFTGWGMEDSYFASSLISNGCFVIPILSSCVFHINHPPRSGSMEQKAKEAAKNFELYNRMLDEKWEG
jgi:GT2 family glycosyltransferase